jgi:transcriptional regulator with XRE-family HTH domain
MTGGSAPGDGKSDDQGRFARTRANDICARALKAARLSLRPKDATTQAAFAEALAAALDVAISSTTLSGWETNRRTVPGPVLEEAAKVAGLSLDLLLAEAEAEIEAEEGRVQGRAAAGARSPRTAPDLERAQSIPARLQHLERETKEHGKLLAAVLMTLQRRNIRLGEAELPPDEQATGTEQ